VSGGNYRFDLDLPEGEVAEGLLRDILTTEGRLLAEVKRDFRVSETERIAVEIESRGRPSGIETTEAEWWFHFLSGPCFDGLDEKPEVVLGIRVVRLKALLHRLESEGRLRVFGGGDGGSSQLLCFKPKELLRPRIVRVSDRAA